MELRLCSILSAMNVALIQKGKRVADVLFSTTKVIHGHFLFSEIEDLVERDDPKLVTFMRQPNERVISNYHWWKHTIEENPNHPVHYRRMKRLSCTPVVWKLKIR